MTLVIRSCLLLQLLFLSLLCFFFFFRRIACVLRRQRVFAHFNRLILFSISVMPCHFANNLMIFTLDFFTPARARALCASLHFPSLSFAGLFFKKSARTSIFLRIILVRHCVRHCIIGVIIGLCSQPLITCHPSDTFAQG